MNATLAANIERLQSRAAMEARDAPLAQKIADRITRFTGSITFVAIHVVVYGAWIAANLG